jgi:hypothetical protein
MRQETVLDLRERRIGYVPVSEGLGHPGDRRRFCFYARRRNIPFEIARPSESYDVVVVTAGGDISPWKQYATGNAKIIYDQVDSYLAISSRSIKGLLRGAAKFALRQNRHLLLNYSAGIRDMCRRADAVICSTEEQRRDILPYCGNVHRILDFQSDTLRSIKKDYRAGDIFNFVWEGLPENMWFLGEIRPVLLELQKKRKIAIHVITALRYGKYLHGRLAQRRTEDEARKIFDPLYVYSWNEYTCSGVCTSCDLALISIPLHNPFAAGKPENKLLFFWRLGIPAIVSATPAHVRAMKECGLAMSCQTPLDWRTTLERYISDEHARREAGQQGKAFADSQHSEEKLLAQWDNVFSSVLGQTEEKHNDTERAEFLTTQK